MIISQWRKKILLFSNTFEKGVSLSGLENWSNDLLHRPSFSKPANNKRDHFQSKLESISIIKGVDSIGVDFLFFK